MIMKFYNWMNGRYVKIERRELEAYHDVSDKASRLIAEWLTLSGSEEDWYKLSNLIKELDDSLNNLDG